MMSSKKKKRKKEKKKKRKKEKKKKRKKEKKKKRKKEKKKRNYPNTLEAICRLHNHLEPGNLPKKEKTNK